MPHGETTEETASAAIAGGLYGYNTVVWIVWNACCRIGEGVVVILMSTSTLLHGDSSITMPLMMMMMINYLMM